MNRIIKFRAWDKHNKKMSKVDALLLDTDEVMTSDNMGEPKMSYHYEIMQFTGLLDKNGKEIYEGDILRRGEGVSFVVWCLDGWRYNSWMPGGQELYMSVDRTRGASHLIAEVIGNIHESPELLSPK